MKVALIHDHLAQDGGAERVLRVFSDMFPEAPIYTLLCEKGMEEEVFKGRKIEKSIIQRLPGGVKHYRWYLSFMPIAVEFFDLRGFDVVISDTSAFAKGVITSPETLHICYCHTPTRYLWSDTHQYINELKYNKFFKKIISIVLNRIRIWDRLAADRVDVFIANSQIVKSRIKKYYRRESVVVNPPVDTDRFKLSESNEGYYLIGCRLEPYKRVDMVIEVFKKNGKKLKIFGSGTDFNRLTKLAEGSDNIEFLGRLDDNSLTDLYGKCKAFINPQLEDFGITMVEAMASGKPVIAFNKGGASEIVADGKTGVLYDTANQDSLAKAIERFESIDFDSGVIREAAEYYSINNFKKRINDFIDEELHEFRK